MQTNNSKPPAASDLPSEAGREMAEEVRQSAPDFGVPKWLRNSDFSTHLAECFDVSYGMGQAFERAKAVLDKPPAAGDLLSDLVARFSAALLDKLQAAEEKYGWENGWIETGWEADCQQALLKHLGKSDPRDVAAYCAFLWHHGWPTVAPTPPATSDLRELAADFLWERYYATEEDNTITREDLIVNDGSCEALATLFAIIRVEGKAEGLALGKPPAASDLRERALREARNLLADDPDEMDEDWLAGIVVAARADAKVEGWEDAREQCARLVEEACGPDDSDLAERAADAYNQGSMKRPVAERLQDHGAVIAAAIRAANRPSPTEREELK